MNSQDVSQAHTGEPSLTAGQMLRAAREAQGMHLALLSVNLKVSVRQLEALEADQHEVFKGTPFVRALAQSVCRQLKIDPAPVLAALPKAAAAQVQELANLATRQPGSSRPEPQPATVTTTQGLSRQVLLLATLMLAGAAALIWWPASPAPAGQPDTAAQPPLPTTDVATPPSPVPASEPVAAQGGTTAVPAAQPVVQAPASSVASAAVVAVAAAAAPVPAVPASSAPSASQAPDTALVLKLSADAWVEIRDSRTELVVKRQVSASETLRLQIAAPLFVYISRADAAQLSWQGKPLDLSPHTQNNEVRLRIRP